LRKRQDVASKTVTNIANRRDAGKHVEAPKPLRAKDEFKGAVEVKRRVENED
jgi:hypothetical protein